MRLKTGINEGGQVGHLSEFLVPMFPPYSFVLRVDNVIVYVC